VGPVSRFCLSVWNRALLGNLFALMLIAIMGAAALQAQTNEWTWMGGSSTLPCKSECGQPGVYGELGVPAARNSPGGRAGAASWTDSSGNLWLFGGQGFASTGSQEYLNDVWEFNRATNQWTWMGGSNSGPVLGSLGPSGSYGILQQPAAGNIPGGRSNSTTWSDASGNLWFFGGIGVDTLGVYGCLNDLWKFNQSTNEWTWMGGSSQISGSQSSCGAAGVYDTMGTSAPGNVPGGRSTATSWIDKAGRFWLLGGLGVDSQGNVGLLNDLWQFDPSTNEWTWAGGSNDVPVTIDGSGGQRGIYGTQGTPTVGNFPEAAKERIVGPMSAETSGFLEVSALMQKALEAYSMICGSLAQPAVNGHGYVGATSL
jgi:hypothetical protein